MVREQVRHGSKTTMVMRVSPGQFPPAAGKTPRGFWHRAAVAGGAVAAVALLAAIVAPRLLTRPVEAAHGAEESARRVSVARPERAAAGEMTLPATLQAYQWTDLHPRVSGYLKRWSADLGTRVKAGQVLAEIDTPELDQEVEQAVAQLGQGRSELEQARAELEEGRSEVQLAEANLVRAKAHVDFAAAQADRYQKLVGRGAVSREEYESSARDRDARKADQEASRADVERRRTNLGTREAVIKSREASVKTREASVQRLRELQGFKKIVAPFDGVVTRRLAEVGMLVSADETQPLFRVAQDDVLRVQVNVPQAYAGSMRVGDEVAVTVPERPGATLTARVARTASAVEPSSRTLRVELELPNAGGALLPGAYAQLKMTARPGDAVLVVPASVLLMRPDGPHVAAVGEGLTLRLIKVSLGRDLGKRVEVVQGLTGGETLVVNPTDDLRDGQRVQIPSAEHNSDTTVSLR